MLYLDVICLSLMSCYYYIIYEDYDHSCHYATHHGFIVSMLKHRRETASLYMRQTGLEVRLVVLTR